MLRREFIGILGATALCPLAARAQQPAKPVVGFLYVGKADVDAYLGAAFRSGLSETGYTDGQNVTVEYQWAGGDIDRLASLAAELVHRQVTVIAACSTPAALAAKATGTTIPIVFETAGDPIKLGLVKSLNHPGDNVTGVTQLSSELISKRLGLLHELIPAGKVVGLLVDQADPRAEAQVADMNEAARGLGLQMAIIPIRNEDEIDKAFANISQVGARGLLVGTGEFLRRRAEQIVRLAAQQNLPAIYQYREFAKVGGLISYGTSLVDSYRQAGVYTGRVLKGEKPGEIPVLQAAKFDLVINLKTAKALSLTIPPGVLAIADEVIE
ncbi:MAG TPA: ABC transporter substrate-binding protein [Xanthobacteraceae bacterium]|nr:ABC transporter substrate-binding protein [Xanthobacteraceae bacterium]